MEEIQCPDACKVIGEEAFFDSCMYEGGTSDLRDVSDWVRRSVLFWNQSDTQQDNSSVCGGSDDASCNVADQAENQPDNRSDNQSHNSSDRQSDSSSSEPENNVLIGDLSETDKNLPNRPSLESLNDSQTEPTKIFDTIQCASTNDMKVDVENIQKFLIEPFIMEDETDRKIPCGDLDNDPAYYTLNFPKYTEHVYSPLYEEHVRLKADIVDPFLKEGHDWTIAERLNRLNQTRGQLMSDNCNTEIEETCDLLEEHGEEMERASVDSDIFTAIKKVQDTLGEIADELETTRTRKSSKDRDPTLILMNLLSRIQPPVNRDSYSYSPTEDAPQTCQELPECQGTSLTEETVMSNLGINDAVSKETKSKGDEETEFDVFRELSDPQKSTEEVLQEFMQKLSSSSKPSSAIRGLLKRISEEISSDTSVELHHNSDALEFKRKERKSPLNSQPCHIIVEHESGAEGDSTNDKSNDVACASSEKRISSISGNSSLPTSPNATNYDSGFSELTKSLSYTRKGNLTSFLPDESTKHNMEKRLREAFEKTRNGFDSETSTDWSPCSTLSNSDLALKSASGLKHSPFQRVTPRRRSTGMTSSKPVFRFQPRNTNSCPNFERRTSSYMLDPLKRYTKAEVDAIRKFLSLTSVYFGCQGTLPGEIRSDNYEELVQRGDTEVIIDLLKLQRADLEKQRRKQDELFNQLGDMLLKLVTLKEEHLVSTQKQTKALTLLKRQLDLQKKEQQRAQEAIRKQVNSLGERLSLDMTEQARQYSTSSPILSPVHEKHTGQIVWRITGITRKVTRIHAGSSDNITISEAFYSGPYGYKMAAWVYLNGRADFQGKGISVYVCPLCGEYDAILPWPIKPIYTFTLIDQNPDPSKKRNHVKVRNIVEVSKKGDTALAGKGGIPRPKQGNKSFIIGFDDFITQAELASSKYIVEDTMFLKVKAEIN